DRRGGWGGFQAWVVSGAPSPTLPRACLPPPAPSGRGRHRPNEKEASFGDGCGRPSPVRGGCVADARERGRGRGPRRIAVPRRVNKVKPVSTAPATRPGGR